MDIISLLQQVAGFRNRLHFIMLQQLAGSRKKERVIDFVRSATHDGCIRAKTRNRFNFVTSVVLCLDKADFPKI